MVSDPAPRQPRSFLRFGIRTLLMMMTLLATLIASETNRYRHRTIVEKSFPSGFVDNVRYSTRFTDTIDPSGFLASNLTKLVGPRWNQVVSSVVISHELDDGVFDSVSELNHLHTLGFMGSDLAERQCTRLAEMKSLRWIYFVNANVDQATIESLRMALPNTYVTGFDYR